MLTGGLDGDWSAFDLLAVRIGLAYAVWVGCFHRNLRFSSQPRPVGLARLLDLTLLHSTRWGREIDAVMVVVLAAYVAGIALPYSTSAIALFVAAVGSLASSQGGVGHSLQGLGLVCLVQSLAYVGFALFAPPAPPQGVDAAVVDGCRQALIAVYFTSGLTKLHRSRLQWIWRGPALSVQIVKTAEQKFQQSPDAARRDRRLRLADRVVGHPAAARFAAAAALACELASPLFLLHPLAAFLGGLTLILFHQINGFVLGHFFSVLQILLLVLFVNPLLLF